MKEIKSIDWEEANESLDSKGYTIIPSILSQEDCQSLTELYAKNDLYRSTINMQRYRFGKGEYRYFSYPLPTIIQQLRESLYLQLSSLANEWMTRLSTETVFPSYHSELITQCYSKGQVRPTPLILRYETGGFNTLHQDLYGEVYFPFQVVFVLNEGEKDFEGGEFVLIEQLPRAQSKVEVLKPHQGDALIFTTNFRPVKGTRGFYRAKIKHGISPLRSGIRYALGIIFHDAS